jgi:hypothetical protein
MRTAPSRNPEFGDRLKLQIFRTPERKMKNRLQMAIAFVCLLGILLTQSAMATVITRSAQIELGNFVQGGLDQDNFITQVATFAPATLSVGDTLRLSISFLNNDALHLIDNGGQESTLYALSISDGSSLTGDTRVVWHFQGVQGSLLLPDNFIIGQGGGWGTGATEPFLNLTDTNFSFTGLDLDFLIQNIHVGSAVTFNGVSLKTNGFAFGQVSEPNAFPLLALGVILAWTGRFQSRKRELNIKQPK